MSSTSVSFFFFSLSFLFLATQGRSISYTSSLESSYSESTISVSPSQAPEASGPATEPKPESEHDPETMIFDVRSFGAIGDGIFDETQAFKMAWDTACHTEEESVIILVPRSYTFMIQSTIFTGPCKTSSLTLQIDGTVMPPDGPDSWPKSNSKRQWLVFYRVNGMALQGSGVINGRGEKWWDLPCKPHKGGSTSAGPCDSPVAIRFFMSSNLIVKGLSVKSSPQFHFRFDGCENVHVESLTIKAPARSPNTDGIHIENSNNVGIYNSLISNGDDCVSIGAGCHNVDIKNITCGPSHGISIGSLGMRNSRACVSNITVRDSIIRNSDNGVRIKTWQGGTGSVSDVRFENIEMDSVRNPIIVDQFYCSTKNCPNQTSAVYISDVFYSDIRGTYDNRSPAIRFACSDSVPCTNLTLAGVQLFPARESSIPTGPICWNAYGDMRTITYPLAVCLLNGFPDSIKERNVDMC